MDVTSSPVTLDVPEKVTIEIPKAIVLERNAVIGIAVAVTCIVVGTKIINSRRRKLLAKAIMDEAQNQ